MIDTDLKIEQQIEFCNSLLAGNTAIPDQGHMLSQVLGDIRKELSSVDLESNDPAAQEDSVQEHMVGRLIDYALELRKNGYCAYYLAMVIASAFMKNRVEGDFLAALAEYTDEVGIKFAIKRYTKLDREVDLIQLISEQYDTLKSGRLTKWSFDQIQMIKSSYEKAYAAEVKYHGCSQCVLIGLSEVFSQVDPVLFKAATALSGGMAQCGDGACGGYSGGILYMGTYIGRSWEHRDADKDNQYKSFDMAQTLHDRYVETYGGVTGKNIHEKIFGDFYLLRDEKAKKAFGNIGAHEYKCPCVVGSAARWVAEILIDEKLF